MDFVDAHVHFYDMNHPDLFYAHWQPDVDPPLIGKQMRKLGERNFLADDFIALTRQPANALTVTKAIHVQAAIGSADPVKETEWLQAAFERTGFPHAIVAHADLRSPDVERVLQRHCAHPNMRGIRDFSHGDYLTAPDFRRGYALLQKYNLIASIAAQWQDMENLIALARQFPNTPIVLDHAALPAERTPAYYRRWRAGLSTAASAPNIICKISGLGMADHHWTPATIRPYILACIETFGPHRSLFATNWPVDALFSDYATLLSAYAEITADFSPDERRAMFSGNAERLYRI